MIHFLAVGPPHEDGQVVTQIKDDNDCIVGYLVTTPELVASIQAAIELASNIYAALHYGEA